MLQNVKSSRNGVFWALLMIFHTLHGCAGGMRATYKVPEKAKTLS